MNARGGGGCACDDVVGCCDSGGDVDVDGRGGGGCDGDVDGDDDGGDSCCGS